MCPDQPIFTFFRFFGPSEPLCALSRGKLTIPNQDLLEICRDLNEAFEAFHGESIDMDPNPIERLQEQVLAEQEKNDVYSYVCNIFRNWWYHLRYEVKPMIIKFIILQNSQV